MGSENICMRDSLQGELIILNQWKIRWKLALIFKGVLENYSSVVIRIEFRGWGTEWWYEIWKGWGTWLGNKEYGWGVLYSWGQGRWVWIKVRDTKGREKDKWDRFRNEATIPFTSYEPEWISTTEGCLVSHQTSIMELFEDFSC